MKKHLSFILLAALAFTLLLPFNKPQTVQAEVSGVFTIYANNVYDLVDGEHDRTFYKPFHDTENKYSDTSKFQLVSRNPGIGEANSIKVSGPYGTGSLKIFTVDYKVLPKAEGETDLDLTYAGKVVSAKFVHLRVYPGGDVTGGQLTKTNTMYRIYNPNSGEHFYTSSEKEKSHLVSLGWNDEGIGWKAPAEGELEAGDPVYRLYNAVGGEHHYTTSEKEKNTLVAIGWKCEGIGWYSDKEHDVPVYRQYNPNAFANNHNYTTSEKEKDILVALGWKDEGIAWYAY